LEELTVDERIMRLLEGL